MAQQGKQNQEPDLNQLLKVRREKLAELQASGKDPFLHTTYDVTHHSKEIKDKFDELDGKEVSVAGRMMSKRVMGKASFCNVQDIQGQIQCYVARDNVGEESYKDFKKMDIGDIVGIVGTVFRTKTGEISIHVTSITLLSKSLQILPEKFHGLTNTDLRYRQRYVDLIMNEDVKETFITRSRIISCIRRFLDGEGFLEVETPMLVSNAGGAAARPFETHFNALDQHMVLRIAPELYLKRLLVGGMNKVFELGKDFRNEGIDRSHNPEFTVLEVYEAYGDRTSMENIIEGLIPHLCDTVIGTRQIEYGEAKEIIDFTPPYRRVSYGDLVKAKMGDDWFDLPFEAQMEKAKAAGKAENINLELDDATNSLMLTHEVYDKMIEKTLRQPTFVTRLPHEFVPLAKACEDDPKLVDVFEFVVGGRELCPGYTEQNNPLEQRKALENQAGEDTEKIDEDFISALECGMPPTGGLGQAVRGLRERGAFRRGHWADPPSPRAQAT